MKNVNTTMRSDDDDTDERSLCARCTSNEFSETFHKNLMQFTRDLMKQYPKKPDLVVCALYVENDVRDVEIVVKFILHILPLEREIKAKNVKFILAKKTLSTFLTKEHTQNIRKAWRFFRKSERKIIWDWLDVFLHFAKKYASSQNISFPKRRVLID